MPPKSFTVSPSGNWPNEVYNVNPDFNIINSDIQPILGQNRFKYLNYALTEADPTVVDPTFIYRNATQQPDDLALKQFFLNDNSTFTWNISSLRLSDTGPIINYFYLDLPVNANESIRNSYLLYPYRILLRPISAEKISDSDYRLVTSAVLVSSNVVYFNSISAEEEAYDYHINQYLNLQPSYINIPANNNLNLIYSISAVELYGDRSLLSYGSPTKRNYFNPSSFAVNLGKPRSTIKSDRISFSYNVFYPPNATRLGQNFNEDNGDNTGFGSTYILKYNPNISNTATFLLAQSSINENVNLEEYENNILRCSINLSSTNLQYFNYRILTESGLVPLVSGYPDSDLRIQYVSETPYILNSSVHSTLNSLLLGTTNQTLANLGALTVTSTQSNQRATWSLKYPPHYYSYIIAFNNSTLGFNKKSETSNLVFYISSGITNIAPLTAYVKTMLVSDYHNLSLPLSTYANKDLIKFKAVNINNSDDSTVLNAIISSFEIQYSPNNVNYYSYDIKNPTWINAASAGFIKIVYDKTYGEVDLCLRPSLSTSISTTIEALKPVRIKFAQGSLQVPPGSIFLNVLDEQQNYVDLTLSHLTDEQVFPYKDLTNSLISWNYTPNTNPYISINSLQTNSKITPNSAIAFNSENASVRISGFGPDSIVIKASSQKYEQFDDFITNGGLFDLFSQAEFKVGLSKNIQNFKDNKTLSLTGIFEFQGEEYEIPQNTPLYWTWEYNDVTNPLTLPITAYNIKDNQKYTFGKKLLAQNISSIRLDVGNFFDPKLLANPNEPVNNELTVYLYSNVKNPPISGSFSILLNDYPSREVFNTDFKTAYNSYSVGSFAGKNAINILRNTIISDTRNNQYVLTRPDNFWNDFIFYANTDVMPRLTADNFVWSLSSNNAVGVSNLSSTKFSDISSFRALFTGNETMATITLCALNARLPNWSEKFSTSTTLTFYKEPSARFFKPFEFVIFPPYTWGLSGQYLKLLDGYNYTLAQGPTAYRNKVSNSQEFWLSANKTEFNEYNIFCGQERSFVNFLSTNSGLVNFPYRSEFYQNSGLKVTMIGYSEKYPAYNGLTFQAVQGYNPTVGYAMKTFSFNITAETTPNTSLTALSSRFKQSPKLKDYDPILLSFTPNFTSVDLDENRIISIDQTFLTQNNGDLSAQPTQNVQQMFSSNFVIYTLSSENWQVRQFVPALKGAYDLFILAVGDPAKPLNISKYNFNTLKLTASGTMPMQILPSTFDLYPTQSLTANCVAFWNFDELSGTRIDSTGNGNNLELTTFGSNLIGDVESEFNAWSKTNVAVYENSEIAPNGTNTADKIYINTNTNVGKFVSDISPSLVSTKSYNFSVYAKPFEIGVLVLNIPSGGAFSATQTVTYNLTGGTVSSSGSLISNIKMETLDNDWYKCSVQLNPNQNGTADIRLYLRQATAFVGNLEDGLGLWNASLQEKIALDAYPLSAIGIIGKSLSAAITGVYLQASGFDFGSDWTLSYWQKLDLPSNQIPAFDNFITKSIDPTNATPLSGITITSSPYIIYNNRPRFQNGLIYSGPFVKPYEWNHIVFSVSQKLMSVYLNGNLITDDIFTADALYDYFSISNGQPFRISGLNKPIYLDAMGFWNRSLKSADVYNLYNGGSAVQYPFENIIENYSGERNLWRMTNEPISAGPTTLVAYSTTVMPEVYLSTYFALTGEEIFIQFETPQNIPPDAPINIQSVYISAYKINFGENSNANAPEQPTEVYAISAFSDVNDTVRYSYSTPGIYNLTYDVVYNTGEVKRLELESPITIYNEWPQFDQQKIRLLNETILEFGNKEENTYTFNEIEIQPNEFGDVDIYNTAISRLYDNFQYIRFNSQTINTNSPTLFYGWLGCEEQNTNRGIQWNTKDYGFFEWDKPYLAVTLSTANCFEDVKSFSETKDHLLVVDGTKFRAFSAGKIPQERFFENIADVSPLITNPISIDSYSDETGNYAYILDSVKNRVYKFNLDFGFIPQINVQLSIGNFGAKEDNNKFNSPTEIEFKHDNLYVLDYNNRCIKQFTSDLNWLYTYYSEDFETDRPESMTIHPLANINLLYVITRNKVVYIFDQLTETFFEKINLPETQDGLEVKKISFDQNGEFFYVTTEKNIYKYSATGLFISKVDIPNSESLVYNHIKAAPFRSVLIGTKNSILRIQDVVQYFKIGDGLEQNFWTKEQIILNREEFAQDLNYNKSLVKMAQNIKSFRDIINSKFVIATEQLPSGTVSYFTLVPIDGNLDRPVFSDFIENENLGVGVNEFHIPQVLNRELKKIYDALVTLKDYLAVSDIRVQAGVNKGCFSPFCWSWRAMSCYNLSLPVIRICNVNPITYVELENSFPIKYAPSTLWGTASSLCCRDFKATANPLVGR